MRSARLILVGLGLAALDAAAAGRALAALGLVAVAWGVDELLAVQTSGRRRS